MTTPVVDRPPAGWLVLDVMREREGEWDWAALMIDIDPESEVWLERLCPVCESFVRIPGKHTSRAAACDALEAMLATRH